MSNGVKEYFKIAVRNLKTRRLRSWLTILGIVVGVFLVITLISLSGGIRDTIMKQLKALGGDVIFVLPGAMDNPMLSFIGGEKLSEQDIKVIKKVEGVDIVLPMSYSSKIMRYKNEQKTVFLTGIPWDEGTEILVRFQGWSLNEGRWPKAGKRELIIGSVVAKEDFFGKKVRAGDEASIAGKTFKIVGILKSLGSKSDDTAVYLDRDIYQQITGDREGGAQAAMVKIKEGASADGVAEKIEEEFVLEVPKITIPSGASAEEIAELINQSFTKLTDGVKKAHSSAKAAALGEIRGREQKTEVAKVSKIRGKIGEELWFKLFPVMNAQYQATGDIEAAVRVAAKDLGVENPLTGKETKSTETKEPKKEAKIPASSSIKSSESEPGVKVEDLSKVKPANTKAAATEALAEILKKRNENLEEEDGIV